MKVAKSAASIDVRRVRHRARVHNQQICGGRIPHGFEPAVPERCFDGRAVRLRGATSETLDKDPFHTSSFAILG